MSLRRKEHKEISAGAKSCAQRNEKFKERPDAKLIISVIILQPVKGKGSKISSDYKNTKESLCRCN